MTRLAPDPLLERVARDPDAPALIARSASWSRVEMLRAADGLAHARERARFESRIPRAAVFGQQQYHRRAHIEPTQQITLAELARMRRNIQRLYDARSTRPKHGAAWATPNSWTRRSRSPRM